MSFMGCYGEEKREAVMIILGNINKSVVLTAEDQSFYKTFEGKFAQLLVKLENYGPTAKLWVQYFSMVTLVKQFIEVERSGNWQLYLQTIQKVLPFFHACGYVFTQNQYNYIFRIWHLKSASNLQREIFLQFDEWINFGTEHGQIYALNRR
ncbi:hypothetical protein ALC57_08305 [Trachymyrmex cornetzi]|uniref:Uncharacterized protein n=1 Tax=Trachymyrmex cornetzi TaxID=471704 RepID=A0A151J728_9HYME|nr:hypothetical protein ALC57_08305 [Trachymyrmex cornetzi]